MKIKGYIYKLSTDANDSTDRFKIYIGPTSHPLDYRLSLHKYIGICDCIINSRDIAIDISIESITG